MAYPKISGARRVRLLEAARGLSVTQPAVTFPDWYLKQWHFHPDGYLSRAAIRRYELLIDRLYNVGAGRSIDRVVAGYAAKRAPSGVVELGCGTGHLVKRLARRLPEATISGIDLSPFMVERARARLARESNVAVHHGDATRRGTIPGPVDLVVAVHLFGHIPAERAATAFELAAEAITPDGAVLTVDHRWHPEPVVPSGLRLRHAKNLLGGLMVMREYRAE